MPLTFNSQAEPPLPPGDESVGESDADSYPRREAEGVTHPPASGGEPVPKRSIVILEGSAMKGSPEMAKSQSWSALLSAIVTRLTPRALALLLLVFLVLVFGLLAFGLATGRDVVVSWKELSAKRPPSEGTTVIPDAALEPDEIDQMTGGLASDETGLRILYAAVSDSLRDYRQLIEKPEMIFLFLDEALDRQQNNSINTAWTQGSQTDAYRLIQAGLGLVYADVAVDGDRVSTMEAVIRFQEEYNARAMERDEPILQPLGVFGRRTLRALEDSYHSLSDAA